MTRPVKSAARANGTITYQPVNSIATQAPRTVRASWLVTEEMPSAKYATTAPIQPIESVRCAARTSLRRPGAMVMGVNRRGSRFLGSVFCEARGRRAATPTRAHVATRAVATRAAGEEQDDNQQHQAERDDPKHLHPAWCAGVGGQVSHVGVL